MTVIGSGTDSVRVVVQGQPNENVNITPFGTTYGWVDGTLLRHGATLELAARLGDSSRDGQ